MSFWALIGDTLLVYDFQPVWDNNQINFNMLALISNSEAKIYVFVPKNI